MLGKIFPILLALIGIGAGLGAGLYLRPDPPDAEFADERSVPVLAPDTPLSSFEFPNQFMVPLVTEGRISGTMVLRLALELPEQQTPIIEANAARLRDALLQVMFDHANSGGFDGTFTDHGPLGVLRRALLEAALTVTGPGTVNRVLITDILRTGA